MPLLTVAVYLPITLSLLFAVYLISGVFGIAACLIGGVVCAVNKFQ